MRACEVDGSVSEEQYVTFDLNGQTYEGYLVGTYGESAHVLCRILGTITSQEVPVESLNYKFGYCLNKINDIYPEILDVIEDPENLTHNQIVNLVKEHQSKRYELLKTEYEMNLTKITNDYDQLKSDN